MESRFLQLQFKNRKLFFLYKYASNVIFLFTDTAIKGK